MVQRRVALVAQRQSAPVSSPSGRSGCTTAASVRNWTRLTLGRPARYIVEGAVIVGWLGVGDQAVRYSGVAAERELAGLDGHLGHGAALTEIHQLMSVSLLCSGIRPRRGPVGRQPVRQEFHPAAARFVSDDDRRFVVGDCV